MEEKPPVEDDSERNEAPEAWDAPESAKDEVNDEVLAVPESETTPERATRGSARRRARRLCRG